MTMPYIAGTRIRVTELQRKDFSWPKGAFEELSGRVNGAEGILMSYNKEMPEYGERASYMARIYTSDGEHSDIEIEEDEFVLIT